MDWQGSDISGPVRAVIHVLDRPSPGDLRVALRPIRGQAAHLAMSHSLTCGNGDHHAVPSRQRAIRGFLVLDVVPCLIPSPSSGSVRWLRLQLLCQSFLLCQFGQ